jgi:hypothetical protein
MRSNVNACLFCLLQGYYTGNSDCALKTFTPGQMPGPAASMSATGRTNASMDRSHMAQAEGWACQSGAISGF